MSYDAIVISGLRRSGTTALWECFRNHDGIAAYDEPFHPKLAEGVRSNPKGTWVEIAQALDRNSIDPQPIHPSDELHSAPPDSHREYLTDLLNTEARVVVDVVRCWNNLPQLLDPSQNILVVHLVRDPRTWVTGHLLPSGKGTWRKPIMDFWRRQSFFTRRGVYNNYHYENIIDEALQTRHPMWSAIPLSVGDLQSSPAYIKLLAFWWASNLRAYQTLKTSGAPHLIVTLPEFSNDPKGTLARISSKVAWDTVDLSSGHVSGTRPPFAETSPKWNAGFERVGIPFSLSDSSQVTEQSLSVAFEAALSREDSAA